MLTPLKTTSVIIIILAAINAAAAVLVLMMVSPDLDPNTKLTVGAFMGSTSIILLTVGIALRNLHSDIETNIESLNSYTASLKKRIEALEKKF